MRSALSWIFGSQKAEENVQRDDGDGSGSSSNLYGVPTSNAILGKDVTLVRCSADMFLWDTNEGEFRIAFKSVQCSVCQIENANFQYCLKINDEDGQNIWLQSLSEEMFHRFDQFNHAFIWNFTQNSQSWTWSLVFQDLNEELQFKQAFARCLWESKTKTELKPDDEYNDWILGAEDEMDVEEKNINKEEDDEVEEIEESFAFTQDVPAPPKRTIFSTPDKNSGLSVGYNVDRSFVVRGSKIGVFGHKVDGDRNPYLEHITTIGDTRNSEDRVFSPTKTMLYQQDQSLVMLSPTDRGKVFRMDTNRGDIIEEWKVGDRQIDTILPVSKYAPKENESTLLGVNGNSFFLIDPRLPKDKLVQEQSFTYTGKSPDFTCASTTAAGQMVMGTSKGEIKLFSQKQMTKKVADPLERKPRAMTNLPGFGDPVRGIDVSDDGKWIVATCRTYLLIVPTEFEQTTGFEKRMGQQKPRPRRLQLLPKDVRMLGSQVNFTPAKFNLGTNGERSIVTSTGPYIVTWNFAAIKKGKMSVYQMKQYDQTVVAEQFAFGTDQKIIVALPDDVVMSSKGVVKKYGE